MENLGEIVTIILGFIYLNLIFYLMKFFTWLKSSWEMILGSIAQVSIVVLIALLLLVIFILLRRWTNAQSAIQKTGLDKKVGPETLVKGVNKGGRLLAIFLLMESIYTGWGIYLWLQTISSMEASNFSEELIGAKPDLWMILPFIAQVVLALHAALFLFKQKAVAVLSLGMATLLSLIGVGYHFNNMQYLGVALTYIMITRVLPLVYTISLLRKGKLN